MIRRPFVIAALAVPVLAASTLAPPNVSVEAANQQPAQRPPGCQNDLPPEPSPLTPTTITAIGQVDDCAFEHDVADGTSDHRMQLAAGFTQELHRRQPDQADATMAAPSGDRDRPAACEKPDPDSGEPPQPPVPATLTTVAQAYECIFDNYYSGPVLDSRTLLVPAFAALTQELQRRGLDQPDATLPELTGGKDADWAAFSEVYQRTADTLPDEARHAVAEAAIKAMVDALDDNHARWLNEYLGKPAGFGLSVSAAFGPGNIDPVAEKPTYINDITPGGPAEESGLKLGDEILAVDGAPLFVNEILNEGVLSTLLTYKAGVTATLTVRRPATGKTFTATVTSRSYKPSPPEATSKLVDGNIAEVSLPGFAPDLVDQALAAIAAMREKTELRGVILDLRGNLGGSPEARSRLLGALAHDKIVSYWCDAMDKCTPNRTDDSVELLHLPVVVLVDGRCASACDSFASAVKDLELGTLVGTRTAGVVSGAGDGYQLENNTLLMLPKYHEIGANKEIVDTIGVAPDHYAPTTAADLSAGRDPALAKAISLL